MKTLLHCTTAPKAACLLAISLLCLLGSIHYAFVILPPAAALSGPGIVPDLYPAWYASRVVSFPSSGSVQLRGDSRDSEHHVSRETGKSE